ncbi:MAG: PKD domain-containing protein [Bacteroidetes bacterium]|nr:PKD domain-containing protein [Bacteroidota bacterium]MDA1119342.1 PKD domain-containing protein [Bacteroidota bacterium]
MNKYFKHHRQVDEFLNMTGKLTMRVTLILCLVTLIFTNTLKGQIINGNNWFFGNSNQALLFNKSDNKGVIEEVQAIPFGMGGSLVISDEYDGNVKFYTDGQNVYDASHKIVPNGTGLTGNPDINQALAACPFPSGNNDQWLLFTNSGVGGVNEIQYSILDLTIPGNATQLNQPELGDVAGTKNVGTGLINPSPGMLMLQSRNLKNFWLISQDSISGEFKSLEISSGMIGNIQSFDLTSASVPKIVAANFSAYRVDSANYRIAVSPQNQNRNVQLLNLNIVNGALTFDSVILNTGNSDSTVESIYDTEWSLDGQILYISRHGGNGNTGNLYQFNFLDTLMNLNSVLPGPVYRSYGIKLAPDSQLYHLYQQTALSPIQLGVIIDPGFAIDSLTYNPAPFANADFIGRQFPEQAKPNISMFNQVVFTALDLCLTVSTKFSPNVEPPPSFYMWDFGDGTTSFSHSPIHTYDQAGMFQVSMTVMLDNVVETFTSSVNIVDTQLMVDLGADTVICRGEILSLDAGPGGISYGWNTGDSTQTIQVDSAGTYWVAVEVPNPTNPGVSCFLSDDIMVEVYGETETISNQWYFGQMAGIDFNENPPVPLVDNNQMNSPEAASTISDINGDLLFYSNGVSVYNKEHEMMLDGFNIGGDSTSAQGALIVPVPQDATSFYIFTTDPSWNDQTFDVKYSFIDLKRDGANGGVALKDRPLYYKGTERLTASGSGGSLIWVVTHEFGNNTFRSYPVTEDGIGSASLSTAGTILSVATEGNSKNTMKLSADVSKLAMTIAGPENFVEVFDYIDTAGQVANPLKINIGEPAPAEIYGVLISPNNEKLYVTTKGGGNSKLIQFTIDTTDVATIEASKAIIAQDAQEFGDLQTGPNGIVYMAVNGSGDLGTINNPNNDASQVGFTLAGFNLGGRLSSLGLPNFVQNASQPPQTPSIAATPGCLGQDSQFTGGGTSSIDEFFWIFGDGGSSMDQNPVNTYNAIGTYTASLRITNRCGLDTTLFTQVVVNVIPPRPTTPGAVALCQDSVVLEALPADDPRYTYSWSTGDTTRQITVTTIATLQVAVIDIQTGCISEIVTVLVGDGRPQVELGPAQTVCVGEQPPQLDAVNPGASYAWMRDGANLGNAGRFQTIDTSLPRSFMYQVAIIDPITSCIGRDSVLVTVNPLPDITLTPTSTSDCGMANGQMDIVFNTAGNFNYDLTSNGVSQASGNFDGPGTIPNFGLSAGSYNLVTTDAVTGCSRSSSANISDTNTGFTATLTANPDCGTNGTVDLSLTADLGTVGSYDYIFSFSNGTVIDNGSASSDLLTFNSPLDTGTYNIVVRTDVPNCVETAQVNLTENPPATITIDPIYNFCSGQGTLTAIVAGGGSLLWTLPDATQVAGNPITVTQSGTYSVTSSGVGFCPQTETTEVIISQDPVVSIDVTGNECDGTLTLSAITDNAGGANSFVWGSADSNNGSVSQVINITQSGTYAVTARNQNTGCQANASVSVNVEPLLEVFITSDPDCDNNGQIFLLAESNITADVIFEWSDPNGSILPDTTAIITISTGGLYTVRVIRRVSGCNASGSLDVVIDLIEEDELLLPSRVVICPDDPLTSVATLYAGIFSTYEWRLEPDQTILSTSQTYQTSVPGRYEVTIGNGLTCIRDYVDVIEDCRPRIFAPTAFTPNGDGLNDSFGVFNNPFVTEFNIFIYNRWGELVYHAENVDFTWDGSFRGDMSPSGTYAYVVTFSSSLDSSLGQIELHGGVTLIR